MNTSITDKRVIVTGASSGLGRAVAKMLVAEGARVAMVARTADKLSAQAAEWGERAVAVPGDVSRPDQCREIVDTAHSVLGGVDAVFNSAGIGFPTPLEDVEPDVWHNVIDTNLSGTFFISREAGLRMLAAGGGSIVNVASDLGSVGMKLFTPYCAAKSGVIGMTKALAADLAPTVRVNVGCPGPIDTPLMTAEIDWYPDPKAVRAEAIERVPLKRFATPDEIASVIRFIAFDAPYMTGAVVPVDGGTTMV